MLRHDPRQHYPHNGESDPVRFHAADTGCSHLRRPVNLRHLVLLHSEYCIDVEHDDMVVHAGLDLDADSFQRL